MRGKIKHSEYEIEYFVYGKGLKVLFAFHGFNNHAEDFKAFGKSLGDEYVIVAVNIFFHGDSNAHNDLVERGFSEEDLRRLFNELSDLFPVEKYTLMGYSLGGRVVMKLIEIIPDRIEKAILLAPDGIRISLFYRFLVRTKAGNRLLKRVVDNPGFFFKLAVFLKKTRLVTEKKYQFAIGNFDSKQKRQKVYLVWMVLRKIISKKSVIKAILKSHNIPMHLFFGKFDNIIPPGIGKDFQRGDEQHITLTLLDSGHRLLKEATLNEISAKLKA